MTIRKCTEPGCYVHDGDDCRLGNRLGLCPAWSASSQEPGDDGSAPSTADDESARVWWSGAALGTDDLALLTMRARSIIVGVVGAHDAGKTTLLTGTYLMAQRGEKIANARFAGSRSLEAWESLAAWTRFDDAARLPTFPPHTPRGVGRMPGLLHVALRGEDDELRDVLLTDAPGEWFTRWAVQRDSPECEGARWTAENADGFLVIADCVRLSGEDRGAARRDTRSIIERIGDIADGRPVTLVWTKSEQQPPATIRRAIEDALVRRIPHATQVESRVDRPSTLCTAVGGVIEACWWPARGENGQAPILAWTPFEAFRGHRGQA